MAGMSSSKLLPELREAYEAVEKFHLVSSYGIQHRMIPPAGRPEIVIEASMDKKTWTELSFMYKPSSMSGVPAILGPHEPRLDWLLWEAARETHDQSPWFSGLIQRLLEGKESVESLVQADKAQYPFSSKPPAFIRAKVYHYHFTHTPNEGKEARTWWKRQYVRDFFPTVHLGDPVLEDLLKEAGLKETPVQSGSDRPVSLPLSASDSNTPLSQALSVLQIHSRGLYGHHLTSGLLVTVAFILLLQTVFPQTRSTKGTKPRPAPSEQRSKKPREHTEPSEKSRGVPNKGGRKEASIERPANFDKSPRRRK